ncbi:MAG: tRNA pseudouridine(55) synthase TruB [Planctomycetales bacterium]
MPDLIPAGILNVDKPAGMSSRHVVDAVARAAGTGRVGHAGTLDPLASGVLVVCVGWTTRLVSQIQELKKSYRAQFRLGATSDTDDVTGTVQEHPNAKLPPRATVEALLPRFTGRIAQVPPSHSAVHVDGRRAYELARRGKPVDLPPRHVEVHRLELIACEGSRLVLEIECGSGTYVRALGRDLGRALGCGAVMSDLVRLAVGAFHQSEAIPPEAITSDTLQRLLLPPLAAVQHLPQYAAGEHDLAEARQGRRFTPDPLPEEIDGTLVALIDPAGSLVGLAEFDAGLRLLKPRQMYGLPGH